MTTYRTAELTEALLNRAVVLVQNQSTNCARYEAWRDAVYPVPYAPASNWTHGGPIIERERINVTWDRGMGIWVACWSDGKHIHRADADRSLLIAAMRAYVMSRFGDTVELP